MNSISKLANIGKNVLFGTNNIIHNNVTIHDNVTIGNNNTFHSNSIIYPNCKIGNNNLFLSNNIIGEYPVDATQFYDIYNGVVIGNDNFFHVNNIIFNGNTKQTIIGDNNKLLSGIYIHHDVTITNNVVLYPRCAIAGYCYLMPYSTMGMNSTLQQKMVLGQYSMIGMGCASAHNVFPYFIFVNGKYLRTNNMKINEKLEINKYSSHLLKIINNVKENGFNELFFEEVNKLPFEIKNTINDFYKMISVYKL